MQRKVKLTATLLLAAATVILMSCKPMAYYLERVYKAYGTVTEAETGNALESVEVFLSPYQYSVLTNGMGDYGIELAEGTWTLDFVREGYVTESRRVTVGAGNPRVNVQVILNRTPGNEAGWTYIGTWVNPLNNGLGGPPGKIVMTVDSFAGYLNDYDTEPMGPPFPLQIEEDWTTAGAHYFKGRAEAAPGVWVYVLLRVTNDNKTLEINTSPTGYPADFTGEPESIFTRR